MAAIRVGARPTSAAPHVAVRRRLAWLAVAGVTGWMAATCLTIPALVLGIVVSTQSTTLTVVATLIATPMLYRRFQRLGRIDDALVVGIALGWSAILGILSL